MKSRAGAALLALVLISVLAPGVGWAESGGCIDWNEVFACPLGQADIAPTPDTNLVVSNIGPSGDDGVELSPMIGTVAAMRVLMESDAVPDPVGAFYDLSWRGQAGGVPDVELGSLREAIVSANVAEVTPDFSSIGSPDYTLQILDEDVLVYEEPLRAGPAVGSRPDRVPSWRSATNRSESLFRSTGWSLPLPSPSKSSAARRCWERGSRSGPRRP